VKWLSLPENIRILPEGIYTPITIFILAPGAFLVLSCMVAVQNKIKNHKPEEKKQAESDLPEAEDSLAVQEGGEA